MTIPDLAFLTMKGGVGKTTLAANITRALADLKPRKILLMTRSRYLVITGTRLNGGTQCMRASPSSG